MTVTQTNVSSQECLTSTQAPQGWNKTWKVMINNSEVTTIVQKSASNQMKSNLFVETRIHFSGSGCFSLFKVTRYDCLWLAGFTTVIYNPFSLTFHQLFWDVLDAAGVLGSVHINFRGVRE